MEIIFLLVVTVVLSAILLALDLWLAPVFLVLTVSGLLLYFGDLTLVNFLYTVAVMFIPYMMLGGVWSLVKWYIFLKKKRREYDDVKLGGHFSTPQGSIYDKTGTLEELEKVRPRASYNKGRIMTWILYWPASILETLIRDSVRIVYESLTNLLDGMSKRIFS